MKLLIKNGRVIDPASNYDKKSDLLVVNKKINKIADKIDEKEADKVIDAKNCLVLPGLIDIHVHFREPGGEAKETILGGSAVAAKGGFTSVCTMPNTNPVIDNQALVRFIKMEAEKGEINIYPVAAVTKCLKGEEISEMGELINAGAVAFSDDGRPIESSLVMRRALEYSKMFNVPIMAHEEDMTLTDSGVINEGETSTILGLKGIPKASEEVMIARDVLLSKLTGGKLHVQHISSGESVDIIRKAKSKSILVTAETAPHYFTLTDEVVMQHLSMAKMNPPLRTAQDRDKIIEGLRDGTIEVIATDHAPHESHEKRKEMEYAPFGIIGLETAVPLIITELINKHNFSYLDAFSKVTSNPAKIIGIDRGTLAKDAIADITIIDPQKEITIDEEFFKSEAKNSPFIGMQLKGSVLYTIADGKVVYQNEK
jgi:dihydroorotase